MVITAHAAVGVIIATQVPSSFLAFTMGIIFHFILDFIPHGDRKLFQLFSKKIHSDLILKLNLLDTFLTIFYLLYIYAYTNLPNNTFLFWSIFGSILPDFLNIYAKIFESKFLNSYARFHDYIHDYIPSKMTIKEGLTLQIIIIIFLVYITV